MPSVGKEVGQGRHFGKIDLQEQIQRLATRTVRVSHTGGQIGQAAELALAPAQVGCGVQADFSGGLGRGQQGVLIGRERGVV